jgi:hypothetical protein
MNFSKPILLTFLLFATELAASVCPDEINDEASLRCHIENAESGTVIEIPGKVIEISSEIQIPSNISILGTGNSTIDSTFNSKYLIGIGNEKT